MGTERVVGRVGARRGALAAVVVLLIALVACASDGEQRVSTAGGGPAESVAAVNGELTVPFDVDDPSRTAASVLVPVPGYGFVVAAPVSGPGDGVAGYTQPRSVVLIDAVERTATDVDVADELGDAPNFEVTGAVAGASDVFVAVRLCRLVFDDTAGTRCLSVGLDGEDSARPVSRVIPVDRATGSAGAAIGVPDGDFDLLSSTGARLVGTVETASDGGSPWSASLQVVELDRAATSWTDVGEPAPLGSSNGLPRPCASGAGEVFIPHGEDPNTFPPATPESPVTVRDIQVAAAGAAPVTVAMDGAPADSFDLVCLDAGALLVARRDPTHFAASFVDPSGARPVPDWPSSSAPDGLAADRSKGILHVFRDRGLDVVVEQFRTADLAATSALGQPVETETIERSTASSPAQAALSGSARNIEDGQRWVSSWSHGDSALVIAFEPVR